MGGEFRCERGKENSRGKPRAVGVDVELMPMAEWCTARRVLSLGQHCLKGLQMLVERHDRSLRFAAPTRSIVVMKTQKKLEEKKDYCCSY